MKIIVTRDLDLTGGDAAEWLADLPRNIDLVFEINDDTTLTLTAAQLHTQVPPQGIVRQDDGNFDYHDGQVRIIDAGPFFDPSNTSDSVRTDIPGKEYPGGSLSSDFWNDENGDGVIQRAEWLGNVGVDRTPDGYNRPNDFISYDRYTWDTAVHGTEMGPFSTLSNFLRIIGDEGVTFTPMDGYVDEYGNRIEGETAIELGVDMGEPIVVRGLDLANTAVADIHMEGQDGAAVSLSMAQIDVLGPDVIRLSHPGVDGTVHVTDLGDQVFDSTAFGDGVAVEVTMVPGRVELAPARNLTGVDEIMVPEGFLTRIGDAP